MYRCGSAYNFLCHYSRLKSTVQLWHLSHNNHAGYRPLRSSRKAALFYRITRASKSASATALCFRYILGICRRSPGIEICSVGEEGNDGLLAWRSHPCVHEAYLIPIRGSFHLTATQHLFFGDNQNTCTSHRKIHDRST